MYTTTGKQTQTIAKSWKSGGERGGGEIKKRNQERGERRVNNLRRGKKQTPERG